MVRKVSRVYQDADDETYVAEFSDGSMEMVECFNCGRKDISIVFLHLHVDSIKTPVPETVATARFESSLRNEGVNGTCWDNDCISFSTMTVSLPAAAATAASATPPGSEGPRL